MIMAVKEEFTVEISAYKVEKAVISYHLIDSIAAPIHKPNEIPIVARWNLVNKHNYFHFACQYATDQ